LSSETRRASIQLVVKPLGYVVTVVSLTAELFATANTFFAKEILKNSIQYASFHCPTNADKLHQSLDAFYQQVYLQMQCLTERRHNFHTKQKIFSFTLF